MRGCLGCVSGIMLGLKGFGVSRHRKPYSLGQLDETIGESHGIWDVQTMGSKVFIYGPQTSFPCELLPEAPHLRMPKMPWLLNVKIPC